MRVAGWPLGAVGGSGSRTQSRHSVSRSRHVFGATVRRPRPIKRGLTDITYIRPGEGWLYLAVILDLCSRFAVAGP